MADRYWVAGTASWFSTSSWSATSGGASGASVPTSADNAIFDRVATYTVAIGTGAAVCANFIVSAGTVTFSNSAGASISVYGNLNIVLATILVRNGSLNFSGTSGTQTITTNGANIRSYVYFNGSVTYQLQDDFLTNDGTYNSFVSLTSGTLDLNGKQLTTPTFNSNNTNVRAIAFGATGKITLLSTGSSTGSVTVWDTTDTTNMSTTGNALVTFANANGGSTARNFFVGNLPESQAISFNISTTLAYSCGLFAGGGTFKNINFTGFTNSLLTHTQVTIYGNLTFSSTMTVNTTSANGAYIFAGSANQTITSNGKALCSPLTIDKTGGTLTLADALALDTAATARTITLANGTFDANSKTISSAGTISASSTGTVTLKNLTTALAYTLTSGTLTQGTANTFGAMTLNNGTFDGGGFTTTASSITMATGTVALNNANMPGNMTHSSGSLTIGGTLTPSFPAYNHNGGTLTLATNAQIGNYTTTNGTLDLAGYTLSIPSFITAAGTKNLTFNGGTLAITNANTTAFNNAVPSGFTTTAGTGTGKISMTASTAKTFVGGGSTYNCTLSNDGLGDLTITGSNTFNSIANSVQPFSLILPAGTTQTVTASFSLSGVSGSLVTIKSDTPYSKAFISRTFNTTAGVLFSAYLSITDIWFNPTPADGSVPYLWYFDSTNVNGGNNLGAVFANNTNSIVYAITQTGAGTWTVPSNFNSANNTIYLFGGGGGGGGGAAGSGTRTGAGGGGGGGFTQISNFSATPGGSISVSVGASGGGGAVAAAGTAGGSTTWNAGAYTAGGGGGGLRASPYTGGSGGTGSTYNGGAGGTGANVAVSSSQISASGGGGGGAGGPLGAGGRGGNGSSGVLLYSGGGGGGGNGGGSNGGAGSSSNNNINITGNGGNNASGSGGGIAPGGDGTFGGGGAGGGGRSSGGIDILNSFGGGSGGGGATNDGLSAAGSIFGGGGSGGGARNGTTGVASAGSAGGQGAIFIVYSVSSSGAFFAIF